MQTSRQQLPGLLELTTFEVVLAEEGPNLGAEAKLLARSFVMLFSFLFVELKKKQLAQSQSVMVHTDLELLALIKDGSHAKMDSLRIIVPGGVLESGLK